MKNTDHQIIRLHGNAAFLTGSVIEGFQSGYAHARPTVANLVAVQQLTKHVHFVGIIAFANNEGFVLPLWLAGRTGVISAEVLHHLRGIFAGNFDGGTTGGEMVLNTIVQGQRIAKTVEDAAPGAGITRLFVGHADGAVEHRVSVAIGRVEQIEHLFGKVQPAVGVEVSGVVLTDLGLESTLPRGDEIVHRLGGRREIIGIVDGLFVQVSVDVRQPALVQYQPLLGLHLGGPGPVPVQIVVVVVRAAAGPGLPVFAGIGIGIVEQVAHLPVPMRVTIIAVGVERRIENHDGVFEPFPHFRFRLGSQLVGQQGAAFRSGGFVAVDAHAQPDDGYGRGQVGGAAGEPRQAQVIDPDLLQAGQVFRGRKIGDLQGATFVGLTVLLQPHRGGGAGRQMLEIGIELGVGRELLPAPELEELVGRLERLAREAGLGRQYMARGQQREH